MLIDSHQHFWSYGTYQTSWMEKSPYAGDTAFAPIRRSFEPADLRPELEMAGVSASITVEAADSSVENASLLANAAANPWIAGVVGWIPLTDPEEAGKMLECLSREPKIVGVRHLINVEIDPDWILRDAVIESLGILAAYGLAFDYVGILPRHLEHVPVLAGRLSDLRIVIDHLGKPPIMNAEFEPWATRLAAAAEAPNVFAKLSGLEAGPGENWSSMDISRYVDHALTVFGSERLMYGSDWPVSILRGGYQKVWHQINAVTSRLAPAERKQIFGGTAIEAYRLKMP